MRELSASFRVYLTTFLVILFWGSTYIGVRIGLHGGYSPGAMALFRYGIASLCMFFIYWRMLRFRRIPLRDVALSAFIGICGFSIYNLALNAGELTINAGMTGFIIAQTPVMVTLIAVAFFGDRLTRWGWVGTIASMMGILFIALSQMQGMHFNNGIAFLLIAALMASLFTIFQKPLLKRMHPIECTALAIWFGTLGLMIYLPPLIKEIPTASVSATLAVVYNGIFPAAIAYLLWSYVLSSSLTSKAVTSLYLVPICSTILGFFILHETITFLEIIGGFLTLLGAFLVNRNTYQKN